MGRMSLLHRQPLRAGAPFRHRHQADGGADPPARGRRSDGDGAGRLHAGAGGSDRGATSLPDYVHPERAFYIFGPEDGTLEPARFKAVKEVIYVPTRGCMNLAASVNVILYDRLAKQLRR